MVRMGDVTSDSRDDGGGAQERSGVEPKTTPPGVLDLARCPRTGGLRCAGPPTGGKPTCFPTLAGNCLRTCGTLSSAPEPALRSTPPALAQR